MTRTIGTIVSGHSLLHAAAVLLAAAFPAGARVDEYHRVRTSSSFDAAKLLEPKMSRRSRRRNRGRGR